MRSSAALLAVAGALGCNGEEQAPPAAAKSDAPRVWFSDWTEASGIDFVHDAGLMPEKHLPETMGAGAALFDADHDRDLDLYFVQGGPMRQGGPQPGTFVEPHGDLPTNRMFLNDGRGRFTDTTRASGGAADTRYGMGVAVGDVNGDGHEDLYVTNLGEDVLLVGDGRGGFVDRTREAGLADARWTTAAIFFDADGDGDLDLFVTGYVLVDLAHPEWCGAREPGWRSACHPDRYPALDDRFWRNRGDGTFEDATAEAGISDPGGKGLGALACDFDRDGDLDLYVANDSTENRMWVNDGRGRFEDATLLSGTGVDEHGSTEASMGVASGDVDGDLDLDLFVTGFDDESDTLYRNDRGGLFTDQTVRAGLEAPTRLPVGFGTVLEDFDLDGDLDLAIANGHIIDNIALYHDGKTHAQRPLLFENDGRGRFRELRADEAGAFGAEELVGRGLYAGDLDGDLDLDLVLTQCGGAARIYRNELPPRPLLRVDGLARGTLVELVLASGRRLLREVGPQPSYFGQSACGEATFALAGDAAVALVVRAPGSDPLTLAIDPPEQDARIEIEQGRVRVRERR